MNDDKLEELNVDLRDLCCFLITLFYKTERKYSCCRTKVGKLLSILAFKYAMNNEKLFNERIYKYDECGTAIEKTGAILYRDEYYEYTYYDGQKKIYDMFNESVELPTRWKREINIPLTVMVDTVDVFRKFGAYSKTDLSEVLNPIVDELTNESYGEIELCKIPLIIDKVDQENKVIQYLKKERISNKVMDHVSGKVKKYKLW